MKLEWLGEYRDLVEKMIKFGNAYANRYQKERYYGGKIQFSPSQLQTMEYILETEDQHPSMAEIALRLGISPSAFSKNVKKMTEKGLLEKYHLAGNRKKVIVKVSPLGRETYRIYSQFALKYRFGPLFEMLDEIPKEYLEKITHIIDVLADWPPKPQPQNEAEEAVLIRIE